MRVLIIGLGSIGRKHVKVLKEISPDVEIFALRSTKSVEPEDKITNVFTYAEIPSDVDFFLVANPTIFHKETIRKLLAYNKPLFIEKPVLHELDDEAYDMLNEIRNKRLFTYAGCPMRFHPCIEYLKEHLETNKPRINEATIYCGSFLPDWRPGRDFRDVYSARPELGGGVHLDLIHEIDYTYFLFGKPGNVRSELRSTSTLHIPAIDYAHYSLEYPDFSASITLNYFRPTPKRNIEVVFENTLWNVDLLASTIKDEKNNVVFTKPVDQHYLLKKQMIVFLETLKEGKSSPNSFEESIEVLKICLNQPN